MNLRKWALPLTLALACLPFSLQAKVVEDMKGNKVELPDTIERVADLWHANNQVVLTLGGQNTLVATTTFIQANPWFNLVYPPIAKVPALTNGKDVQLESLLSVQPQVVLTSSQPMAEQVKQAGIPAVLVMFQDFDGLRKSVQITADVLGEKAQKVAKEYIKVLDDNIQYVSDKVSTISEKDRPTVLHIVAGNNLLRVDGGKSMIGDWITTAGGKNALPDQANMADVTMEEIVRVNPDVIIVDNDPKGEGVAKVMSDEVWKSINAVKNGRVYANPLGVFPWDRYSTEEALQVLWAAKVLHPSVFEALDVRAKTKTFYQQFFHFELTDNMLDRMLAGQHPSKE
ncbi:ABC transporter substrate-binding protein [Pasteurellaceae bacterium TAE3-ERU1]|nr:ABC transporter substrate-binding protein [Pasteurellaceae bacterium TAE3-ERU1]